MRRIKTRMQTDSIKLDTDMVRGFIDEFWQMQKDPEVIKQFWDTHKTKLMAFWLEGISLNIDDYLIQTHTVEERLFTRPELWWVFVAVEPMIHYMEYYDEFDKKRRLLHSDCTEEEESEYLKRNGLLTAREKAATPPAVDPDYTLVQIPANRTVNPNNNSHCGCWKCRLDKLSWQDRLYQVYTP